MLLRQRGRQPSKGRLSRTMWAIRSWALHPIHSLWLDMLARHAALVVKLEDQTDIWCHPSCCL